MKLGLFVVQWGLVALLTSVQAETREQLNEISFREKFKAMMEKKGGSVKLDESISETMAKDMFEKHLQGIAPKAGYAKEKSRRMQDVWDDDDKQYLLDLHNEYRSNTAQGTVTDDGTDGTYPTAADMNELFWDPALAAVAQNYADSTCPTFDHNDNRNTEFYSYTDICTFDYPDSGIYMGENIAALWTTGSISTQDLLKDRADAWYEEHPLWHYQTYSSGSINGAGHYSQLVWANTRYLGCGYTICEDGGWDMYYVVCNYWPGGNYGGNYPYDDGTTYSNCDEDRTSTRDGLCAGCMSSSYDQTGDTDPDDCNNGLGVLFDGATSSPSASPSAVSTSAAPGPGDDDDGDVFDTTASTDSADDSATASLRPFVALIACLFCVSLFV